MAEAEDLEEDLFADLYDGDDNTTVPTGDAAMNAVTTEPEFKPEDADPSGYGQEPETSYLPPPFDTDGSNQHQNDFKREDDYSNNRGQGDTDVQVHRHEPFGSNIKEDGKMFIGGLNWETTDQSLHDYFSQFGEVQECTVMRDGATNRSRGFGFLTFKDAKTVNTVMVKEHFLDGKIVRPTHEESDSRKQTALGSRQYSPIKKPTYLHSGSQIDPKRAIPRDEQEKTSKIFVGGVSQEATEADFTSFFEQFGRVVDATLMMDKDTGRPRGFGFVTFDSEAAVEKCLEYHPLEIMGKPIEVKKAQPRGKMGEEEEGPRGRGRGKFGDNDRFGNENHQSQGQQQGGAMGAGGMTPQMMAQYWQRMQQYFAMMQQQMAATAMGGGMGMGQMNPQMMAQMQQMQQMQAMQKQMQGGQSPAPQSPGGMQNMNPMQQQQMMQQMMQMQGGNMNGMNVPSGPAASRGGFNAAEQQAFEQQKYEQQTIRRGGPPHGPKGNFNQNASQSPQSWEGMYDDVPQPNEPGRGSAGVVRNLTPSNGGSGKGYKGTPTAQPSAAPANAPTGPKNAGKPGANFRGGRGGGRFHPYGRG